MPAVADHALTAKALALHEFAGVGFDEIAFRCGFAGLSGLSNLFKRSIGVGLREAANRSAEWCVTILETERLRGVWAAEDGAVGLNR